MPKRAKDAFAASRREDLGLVRIANRTGLAISLLQSGAVFAIEHNDGAGRILINQLFGSPVAFGMGRLFLRCGGADPAIVTALGPGVRSRFGCVDDRAVWQGEEGGVFFRVTLWLHPERSIWLWRVEVVNRRRDETPCDAVFVQDLGLAGQNFLMGNEAYASQYLDHFVARHPRAGIILMSRQNLAQGGAYPWAAHGCLDGAAGFATDYRDVLGPAHRDADQLRLPFGESLCSSRLQYETACAAIQSRPARLAPGAEASWTFFGVCASDHPEATSEADLAVVDDVERARTAFTSRGVTLRLPARSILDGAPAAVAEPLDAKAIKTRYRRRLHVEQTRGRTLSFFTPDGSHRRHVVLRDKERVAPRRHGAILRSGREMAPTEATLCATCWMHGVFGAQLTIGNTSFHKLFSVTRDPYNITRGGGLRILVELDDAWRLLTVPSAFEMGLGDCVWLYKFGDRVVTITALVAADEPAMVWRVVVDGPPCRFLVFGHLVLGEREFEQAGRIEIDAQRKRFAFRPDLEDGLWGRRYPQALYRLVTSTPECVDAVGADELLYADGKRRSGAYVAFRTRPTASFALAVVGSLTNESDAEALAETYALPVDESAMRERSDKVWRAIARGVRIRNAKGDARAVDTILPWLVHDAMIHLTVPHGLEQYSGAAWGTRDVCQGPLELLLSLEHDEAARAILRTVFARQDETEGDWPQWFMLEPYSDIQDRQAHGDVVVWPLKALCDYIEATGDFDFLDEEVEWRSVGDFQKTVRKSPIAAHADKLIETVRRRFVPGTHLIRYGNGDWNDSLQPVDPSNADWMVSSWTVALLYQQLSRYGEILRRSGRNGAAKELDSLAAAMSADFNLFLVRDGVVAGYGVFDPGGGPPELLLHPTDARTGISFSLIPMIQAIIGGLFTRDQARAHLDVIRKHLLFPDGAHLMERPLPYRGGVETFFRRAESAAFFGREIGLMYTHAHLRFAEAMSMLGKRRAAWDALLIANPIAVTDRLPNASLRQRNAYFSSSDAAFRDRYLACTDWDRVRAGSVAVDGGWRIYSSGPGLYLYVLIQRLFGLRRRFGERIAEPALPSSEKHLRMHGPPGARAQRSARSRRRE